MTAPHKLTAGSRPTASGGLDGGTEINGTELDGIMTDIVWQVAGADALLAPPFAVFPTPDNVAIAVVRAPDVAIVRGPDVRV